jgi:1-deoxy-D-xylulose-5-phosphate reductoisomerase
MRRIIVLGSTGSIGTQALEVISENPERFQVVGLAAGTNAELLEQQRLQFGLDAAECVLGADAATKLVENTDADVVVNGITGSIGLAATLATLRTGKTLALANKESLIVGGSLVTSLAKPGQIVPVDSEHSALAQALLSGTKGEVRKLILTASGGPFRGWSLEQLRDVTPQQALAHPTWVMGKVVTTNSATMVNKGLELIEAHLLFDVPIDDKHEAANCSRNELARARSKRCSRLRLDESRDLDF